MFIGCWRVMKKNQLNKCSWMLWLVEPPLLRSLEYKLRFSSRLREP